MVSRHGERPRSRVSATSPGGRYGIDRVERTILRLLWGLGWFAFIGLCLVPALVIFLGSEC